MSQDPNMNQEIRDTAQQLRQVLTRFDPNDELIKSLNILADAQTALADGDGGEAIECWRDDYHQKRSRKRLLRDWKPPSSDGGGKSICTNLFVREQFGSPRILTYNRMSS